MMQKIQRQGGCVCDAEDLSVRVVVCVMQKIQRQCGCVCDAEDSASVWLCV